MEIIHFIFLEYINYYLEKTFVLIMKVSVLIEYRLKYWYGNGMIFRK